ncbi:hypothetical protein FIBSPDRAFT_879742 [Athelia psychrophila]|uniref:TPR-like protein n=1 Tax=Athelia psychrophila TaxID=1759441 RepID=A0A167TMJ5_9AGAM|nr:hypothetical protein FIBSPDRAFT_879742 [Fibularhizoctonia sp. CBS 109695]
MALRLTGSMSRDLGVSMAHSCHKSRLRHSTLRAKPPLARGYASSPATLRDKISSEGNSRGSVRVTTVFKALLALGIGSTAYGLYEFYTALSLWPPEIRSDLRAGLKAQHQADLGLSERYLRRAYQTAIELPLSTFEPNAYIKLTGIAIALASVLEDDGRAREAWDVYVEALSPPLTNTLSSKLASSSKTGVSTADERLDVARQMAIGHKLGEMAEAYEFGDAEEEKWLSYAVERSLDLQRIHQEATAPAQDGREGVYSQLKTLLADLSLPGWTAEARVQHAAPTASLAAYYSRKGALDYALPLYLKTLEILMPSPPEPPAAFAQRCRAAQVMNNISALIMSQPPTPAFLAQAEAWARKSVDVGSKELLSNPKPRTDEDTEALHECETTMAVALFNLASLREMANERGEAKELFERSLQQAKKIGMREGMLEAQVALRRLQKAEGTPILSQV